MEFQLQWRPAEETSGIPGPVPFWYSADNGSQSLEGRTRPSWHCGYGRSSWVCKSLSRNGNQAEFILPRGSRGQKEVTPWPHPRAGRSCRRWTMGLWDIIVTFQYMFQTKLQVHHLGLFCTLSVVKKGSAMHLRLHRRPAARPVGGSNL